MALEPQTDAQSNDSEQLPLARKLSLLTIPTELQIKIFKDLDWAIYSTCLGLTCKQLYSIHRRLHGTVKLTDIGYTCPSVADEWVDNSHFLHELLTSWIPSTLIYSPYDPPCFTSKERFYEMARTGSWDGGVILQSVNHQSLALRYV